jgi:hypothetical protein
MELLKFASKMNNIRCREFGIHPVMFYDFLKNPVKDKNIVIYGAGGMGRIICKILNDYKIGIKCFCDMNSQKQQAFFVSILSYHRGH